MLPAISNLTNLGQYLQRYPYNNNPGAFEYLVSGAFSQTFFLPFQSKDNEDDSVKHRVIWYGSVSGLKSGAVSRSPGGPDSICFGYGFNILIESTLRQGTSQWRREFLESLTHYDNFVSTMNAEKKDVFVALIAPKLHDHTYTGFRQKASEGYNIILLESSWLAKIGYTAKMAFSVRHLDLRMLFSDIVRLLRDSTSFSKFRRELTKLISEWEKGVLKRERTIFFGLKSYEAMQKVGRSIVGTSEILLNLHKDRKFNHYVEILGVRDLASCIRDGLLLEKLAYLITTPDEDLFCRVNCADYKARGLRLIKEVEGING